MKGKMIRTRFWMVLIYDKIEFYVKKKRLPDMKEGFRPVLQITITEILHNGRNLTANDFRRKKVVALKGENGDNLRSSNLETAVTKL